jgi:anti-sigma28 factor (negative regulator of flagellin synthesis)
MQISNHMSVSGVDSVRAASKASAPAQSVAPTGEPGIASVSDQLDLSPEALAIGSGSGESFRADRVAQLKQVIAEGGYDTDALLDQALSKMIDQLS